MNAFLGICGLSLFACAALLIVLVQLGATPVDNDREKE